MGSKNAERQARVIVLDLVRRRHGKRHGDPREVVRELMKSGRVKRKCCRSKSRCKRCPVLALRAAKELAA